MIFHEFVCALIWFHKRNAKWFRNRERECVCVANARLIKMHSSRAPINASQINKNRQFSDDVCLCVCMCLFFAPFIERQKENDGRECCKKNAMCTTNAFFQKCSVLAACTLIALCKQSQALKKRSKCTRQEWIILLNSIQYCYCGCCCYNGVFVCRFWGE